MPSTAVFLHAGLAARLPLLLLSAECSLYPSSPFRPISSVRSIDELIQNENTSDGIFLCILLIMHKIALY